MIYGSVCSGIEAASVAWHGLGWKPAFFSEIEPYPCDALAHHYPGVPNHGDMTKFKEWPDARIDLLVGGTPCQAFSVAGLRAGLADPRGNLALTYLAIAERYRPDWVVWENVPGVLSDRTGAFGSFLQGLAEVGYGWAYRILDAQYFGLAQRRKRVFVVASARGWACAAAVLFESESLRGHPAPSRETREGSADGLVERPDRGGGNGEDGTGRGIPIIAGCLNSAGGHAVPGNSLQDADQGYLTPVVSHCLNAGGMGRISAESETLIPAPAHCFDARQSDVIQYGNLAGPLDTNGHSQAVVGATSVRRLTPREYERLQGFPDDYTLLPYRRKLAKDCPRYKALGNSMAVPVMRWIGEQIVMVDELRAEWFKAADAADAALAVANKARKAQMEAWEPYWAALRKEQL